jgi:hypothetical protein
MKMLIKERAISGENIKAARPARIQDLRLQSMTNW